MTRGHSFDRCGQTAKWAAGWRSIGNEANVARSPRRIDARRNKKLFRLHLSQFFELMFPEWFTANENARFISAHPVPRPPFRHAEQPTAVHLELTSNQRVQINAARDHVPPSGSR